jgi:hypothetical protein
VGRPEEPKPARLFASIIASEDVFLRQGVDDLSLTFGETDFVSERFPFDRTDYYEKEMGKDLFRRFVTFKRLITIPSLTEIKQATNRLEVKYASPDGRRRINIDPGYLCLEHIILATTKGYSHRPYLRDGVYADLTLIFRKNSFHPLEWTYPDYRQEEVIRLFNAFRGRYLEDLRGRRQPC